MQIWIACMSYSHTMLQIWHCHSQMAWVAQMAVHPHAMIQAFSRFSETIFGGVVILKCIPMYRVWFQHSMLPLEKHSDYLEISSAFTIPMARTYHSELDLGENPGLHSSRCIPLKHRFLDWCQRVTPDWRLSSSQACYHDNSCFSVTTECNEI